MPNLVQTVGFHRWRLLDRLHHCADCQGRAGQVKSMDEWNMAGTPPLHPGCGCQLIFDHSAGRRLAPLGRGSASGAKTEATPDSPPAVLFSPATPAGVNNEAPPQNPHPDPDDYQPDNPPQTPPSTTGPRPRRR